jgi:drug/metabolite transporter (DMT)-like permease
MSKNMLGILVGGLIPALCYGLAGIFQKSSTQGGISLPYYILASGIGVVIVGMVLAIFTQEKMITLESGGYAMAIGLFWALGMTLVAVALSKYNAPVSKLAPLYNMNTLVTVVLGLIIFSEFKEINTVRLLIGALLIVVGGTLVANS